MPSHRAAFRALAALPALCGLAALPAILSFAALPAILSFAALPAAARTPPAVLPIGRGALPWWHRRFEEKQRELAAKRPRLVFYGDSIMQYLEQGPNDRFDFAPVWQHYEGGRGAINLGFKGDPTSALIWRLENGEADGIAPKLAIVMIGANNFGHLHWSAAATIKGIDQVVRIIEQKLPATPILLLGVLPSQRSTYVTDATLATNAALAREYGNGADPRVTYRDLSGIFIRHGRLDTGLFIDPALTPPDPPLHPSPEGWRRIDAAIEPIVARALGDRPRPPMAPLDRFGR